MTQMNADKDECKEKRGTGAGWELIADAFIVIGR